MTSTAWMPASTMRRNAPESRSRLTFRVQQLVDEIRSAGYFAEPVEELVQTTNNSPEADQRMRSLSRRLVVSALIFMPLCDRNCSGPQADLRA